MDQVVVGHAPVAPQHDPVPRAVFDDAVPYGAVGAHEPDAAVIGMRIDNVLRRQGHEVADIPGPESVQRDVRAGGIRRDRGRKHAEIPDRDVRFSAEVKGIVPPLDLHIRRRSPPGAQRYSLLPS